MNSLRSWILCTCLFASSSLMGQSISNSDRRGAEDKEDLQSLHDEETDLILARWQQQLDDSQPEQEVSIILANLERERMEAFLKEEAKSEALLALKEEQDHLMTKQAELVKAIRSVEGEEDIVAAETLDTEDSIESLEESKAQEDLQIYVRDLSRIEQALAEAEIECKNQLEDIEVLREKRFALDVEIEDMQMMNGIPQIITNVEE
ncbi:MAG: hypothetical protein AAF587_19545 [Bacteroidota bacterium]